MALEILQEIADRLGDLPERLAAVLSQQAPAASGPTDSAWQAWQDAPEPMPTDSAWQAWQDAPEPMPAEADRHPWPDEEPAVADSAWQAWQDAPEPVATASPPAWPDEAPAPLPAAPPPAWPDEEPVSPLPKIEPSWTQEAPAPALPSVHPGREETPAVLLAAPEQDDVPPVAPAAGPARREDAPWEAAPPLSAPADAHEEEPIPLAAPGAAESFDSEPLVGAPPSETPGEGNDFARMIVLLERIAAALERQGQGGQGTLNRAGESATPSGYGSRMAAWQASQAKDFDAEEGFPTASPSVNVSSLGGLAGASSVDRGFGSGYRKRASLASSGQRQTRSSAADAKVYSEPGGHGS